jgi:hypothetical protein
VTYPRVLGLLALTIGAIPSPVFAVAGFFIALNLHKRVSALEAKIRH